MSEHTQAPVSDLVMRWVAARALTEVAPLRGEPGEATHYWDLLRLGTAISREVRADRWPDIAHLLQLGAVESWAQVGEALGVTETDARDGYLTWIAGQVDLFRRTGSIGVSPAEAETLLALAERVIL